MAEIIQPFALTYAGYDADRNELLAQSVGTSLVGGAKLYNAVAHYCAFGIVPQGNYSKKFQCYARVPREGSYEYILVIAAIAQEYNLHGAVWQEAMGYVFSRIIDTIKGIWTKPGETESIVKLLSDTLIGQAEVHERTQALLINSLTKSNDNLASLHGQLIDTIPELAIVTRNSARELVDPVGTSCRELRQFSRTDFEVPISEPESEVIKAREPMEVGDMKKFRCMRAFRILCQRKSCRFIGS